MTIINDIVSGAKHTGSSISHSLSSGAKSTKHAFGSAGKWTEHTVSSVANWGADKIGSAGKSILDFGESAMDKFAGIFSSPGLYIVLIGGIAVVLIANSLRK